jgi:hypothetical protein
MKSFVSTLGMATAALTLAGAANAADLPSRKAAPVEYVKVCSAHGTGFFYIPGSDTCLRIGGRVRAEYMYREPLSRDEDATGFRARGRVQLDARTATAYGTLRSFVRFEITQQSGPYAGGFNQSRATVTDLNKAFIQFGGLTAGRAQSFFDFYANDLNWGGTRGSDRTTNLLAYTATFGSGFSATLSLEDSTERNNVGSALAPFQGGTRMPDIVASLRADQAWGSAQLSGAVHQLRAGDGLTGTPANLDTDYGFAGQAGVKLNLPMLAAGDVLWLQAAYAEGATSYLGVGSTVGITSFGVDSRDTSVAVNRAGTGLEFKKTKGYAFTAAFLHYWTPQVRQAVFGSYVNIDHDRVTGLTDFREYQVGSNLIWSPVSGLDIGVEVLYIKLDPKGRVADRNRGGAFTLSSDDNLSARLRIQRDF